MTKRDQFCETKSAIYYLPQPLEVRVEVLVNLGGLSLQRPSDLLLNPVNLESKTFY